MKVAFADSYFYLALMNPRDAAHQCASVVADAFAGTVVTTQWVLVEVADALAKPIHRPSFQRLLATLAGDSRVNIVPADEVWFQKGVDLYHRRSDKEWSLTDCISLAVMDQFGISAVLTGDRHFAQAGYTLLLPAAT